MYFAAKVNSDKCIGCKICIYSCPEPNAIVYDEENKKVIIDVKRCKSCELCLESCPKDAIEMMLIAEAQAESCKE